MATADTQHLNPRCYPVPCIGGPFDGDGPIYLQPDGYTAWFSTPAHPEVGRYDKEGWWESYDELV